MESMFGALMIYLPSTNDLPLHSAVLPIITILDLTLLAEWNSRAIRNKNIPSCAIRNLSIPINNGTSLTELKLSLVFFLTNRENINDV